MGPTSMSRRKASPYPLHGIRSAGPTSVPFRQVLESPDRACLAHGAIPVVGVPPVAVTPASPDHQIVARRRDEQAGKSKGGGNQVGHCC